MSQDLSKGSDLAEKQESSDAQGSGRKSSHFSTRVEDDAMEFIQAIAPFKTVNNQPFPSWTEVFQVFIDLGYKKP